MSFNSADFYTQLDEIFAQKRGSTDALPFLEHALGTVTAQGDKVSELTVLSELLGFNRSHERHTENVDVAHRSLTLYDQLHLEGSPQGTIILINVATALRAAGVYDEAEKLYLKAQELAPDTLPATDRQRAALHNNFSMLYSETGRMGRAAEQLEKALKLMTTASDDPAHDGDVATTLTNLALLELSSGQVDSAYDHSIQAVRIYEQTPSLQSSAHYASVLAGYAQVLVAHGDITQAVTYYTKALEIIEISYGKNSDYYSITAENLEYVKGLTGSSDKADESASQSKSSDNLATHISGLDLSEKYYREYADTLFAGLDDVRKRAAVGLVGHGSECYGFDDEYSRDHDFGPRFCVWLTDEDYAQYGDELQKRYDALPDTFMGIARSSSSPRAGARSGVMTIDAFFESITGLSHAPSDDDIHVWLNLDEATLAAATNGRIFADPFGAFSSRRQSFKNMPDEIRLYLISQRLGMIAQTGQYNYPRMINRADHTAAQLTLAHFVENVASLVFLINTPMSAGYAPYYKWRMAGLRALSERMATRLADVCALLDDLVAHPSQTTINRICAQIVTELRRQNLTSIDEDFLEWHRPYVEAHITSDSPLLHSI